MYPNSPTIDAIDDISAALSAVRESVAILVARLDGRNELTVADGDELQRILDACDRIQSYHLVVRVAESKAHQAQLRSGAHHANH